MKQPGNTNQSCYRVDSTANSKYSHQQEEYDKIQDKRVFKIIGLVKNFATHKYLA